MSLEMPYCYFDKVAPGLCGLAGCTIWMVASLATATSSFENIKMNSKHPGAFTASGMQYFTAKVANQRNYPCPAVDPYNFLVGAEGDSAGYCNGFLPDGRDMRFKYALFDTMGNVAVTNWSDTIRLVIPTVASKPVVSTDVNPPVTTETVSLQMPYCYFKNEIATMCPDKSKCEVWLVSSLTSATSNYVTNNPGQFLSEYPTAYTPNGSNFSTTLINTVDKITCLAGDPYNFLVGAGGVCSESYCNGYLPDGKNMSFKYVLAIDGDDIAETPWSDSITLKARKSPDSLGSGYAGRSGAMVVITTILTITSILLFILLLVTLVLVCCPQKGKAK